MRYFDKRRFLATGVIVAGPGAAFFVMTPIAQECLTMIGWRNTFLVLSGLACLVAFLSCAFDPVVESETTQDFVEPTIDHLRLKSEKGNALPLWRNPTWLVCTLSTAIVGFGAPAPRVHMVSEKRLVPRAHVTFGKKGNEDSG